MSRPVSIAAASTAANTARKEQPQPWYFTPADGAPVLTTAGLWDEWRDKQSGEMIRSATMIIAEPSSATSGRRSAQPGQAHRAKLRLGNHSGQLAHVSLMQHGIARRVVLVEQLQ